MPLLARGAAKPWNREESTQTGIGVGSAAPLRMAEEAEIRKALGPADGKLLVTVPRKGHVPTLVEPEALTAIRAFLDRV